MPNKYAGCQCCSCTPKPMFTDNFDTDKPDWNSTGGPWFVSGGLLNTSSFGTYYRSVTTGATENLRVILSAQALDLAAGHATEKGIFIGGVAAMRHHNVGGSNFRLYLDLGVDALGQNPTESVDMGLIGGNTFLSIRLDKDWNSGTDHYFLFVSGGTGFLGANTYAREIDVSIGSTFAAGVFGDGRYDTFSLSRDHKANGSNCHMCLGCNGNEFPKEIYLSVPPMTNNICGCCEALSGDHVLKFKTSGNLITCQFSAGCMWATDATGSCNEDDICPEGFLWRINNAGTLDATTGVNVLKYDVDFPFDCSPGAVNTWTYSCTVCDDTCNDVPPTLTTVNQL